MSSSKSAEEIEGTVSARILRSENGTTNYREDTLAVEEPLEMAVSNGETSISLGVTFRTPGEDETLVAGFLFSEGIIDRPEQLTSIELKEEQDATLPAQRALARVTPDVHLDQRKSERLFPISAACGACGKSGLEALRIRRQGKLPIEPGQRVDAKTLSSLQAEMRGRQIRFSETGGIHAAARFDVSGRLLGLAEDIGRHNAMDKLVGQAVLGGDLEWTDQLLVFSGRVGYDLIQKAIRIGCPVVISVGAASSFAVELASLFNVTLVGFLRSDRFNVYSAPERILFETPIP